MGLISGAHKARYVPEYQEHVSFMRETYGYDKVRFLERDEIRSLVRTEDFHGGSYDEGAGHLHPLNFALGIADAAEKAGARLFESSRVTSVSEGVRPKVMTEQGDVTADFVVVAGNGYLDRILPVVEARVMPINNFILATEPLGDRVADVIPGREAVADSRFVINYFRISADDRLRVRRWRDLFAKLPRRYRSLCPALHAEAVPAARGRRHRLCLGRDVGDHHAADAAHPSELAPTSMQRAGFPARV